MTEEEIPYEPKAMRLNKIPQPVYEYIQQKQLEFGRGKVRKPNLPNTVILIIKKLIR